MYQLALLAQQGLVYKDSTIRGQKSYFYATWGPWFHQQLLSVDKTGTWTDGKPVVEGMSAAESKALAKQLGYAVSSMANIMPTFTNPEWNYSG